MSVCKLTCKQFVSGENALGERTKIIYSIRRLDAFDIGNLWLEAGGPFNFGFSPFSGVHVIAKKTSHFCIRHIVDATRWRHINARPGFQRFYLISFRQWGLIEQLERRLFDESVSL